MNTTWYLHSHLVWLRLWYSSIMKLPSCAWWLTSREFHRWTTALNVKLLLPPRQSRGASLGRLVEEADERDPALFTPGFLLFRTQRSFVISSRTAARASVFLRLPQHSQRR